MESSPFEVRFRRAVRHALWFSAAFTVVCGVGFAVSAEDASTWGLLTMTGALLFAGNLAAKRVFLP